ncbi:MAG: glycosyltransferase family 39 protein [Opitutaceae bacterium]|jgi:hypothetical protein
MPASPKSNSRFGWILGLGLLARLAAFAWNTRLFGDVNLYALVARQWREIGRLDYPGKFDFFDPAPYLALSTPVSQHPPAWSWLAGLIASAHLGIDEFIGLKLLCLFFGLAVITLGMSLARTLAGDRAAIFTGLVLALHPMLIDFSANGSPYIAVAAGALAVALAVVSDEWNPCLRGVLAGAGAAASCSFHGVGILLIPAGLAGFLFNARPQTRLRVLSAYVGTVALALVPLFLWNEANFGQLLHSSSTFYVQGKLGLISLIDDASGIHYQVGALSWHHAGPYALLALKSSFQFLLHLGLETGFTGLALAAFGTVVLYKNPVRTRAAGLMIVMASIVGPCLGWPEFKYRFLVLLLPFVLILAVVGAMRLASRLRLWKVRLILGASVTGCAAFWITQMALTGSPAKYYAYDLKHLHDYRLMREAADFLRTQPHGVVLSFPRGLDGGVEAMWWHHQPAVLARGFRTPLLKRLVADFRPDYLLLSPGETEKLAAIAPDAVLLFENAGYLVYRRTPAGAATNETIVR